MIIAAIAFLFTLFMLVAFAMAFRID
jgi:hypothetical protein